MSEIQVNALTKGIMVDGLPNPSAIYIDPVTKQPWTSIQTFLNAMEENLIDLVPHMHILVGSSFSSAKEYYNKSGGNVFVEYVAGSSGGTGECSTYIIKASDWNLTSGNMEQTSTGHYTEDQYDKMYNNSVGISKAIKYAYDNGYSSAILEKGIYCFCAYKCAEGLNPSNIMMTDMNNFTFDLGGSTLQLCVDDTEWTKYYSNSGTQHWKQYSTVIFLSYCRDVTIRNGIMLGDRKTRHYTEISSADAEQTYGVMPGGGSRNILIENIEFRYFMGDGVCGGGNKYYVEHSQEEVHRDGAPNIMWKQIGTSYPHVFVKDELTNNENFSQCALSSPFDVTQLYKLEMYPTNRQKDKEDGIYQINFPLGYTKMSSCYPLEMYILTYENSTDETPLRRIAASYLSCFRLTPKEKYIRILTTHEDNLFSEYSTTKTYNNGDRCCRQTDNVICEFEATQDGVTSFPSDISEGYGKWKILSVKSIKASDETYNSSTTYNKGDRMYKNVGTQYVCYRNTYYAQTSGAWDASKWAFESTDRLCVTSVKHDFAIFEYIGSDTVIRNCRFIDNHRGGIANLPHNSIVEKCYFSKHLTKANDGFNLPNPGQNDTQASWSTNYHIDIEDWYSYNVKVKDCRFDPDGDFNKQVTFGCLSAEMTGCTGSVRVNVMSSTYVDIHDNNFDDFVFLTQAHNLKTTSETGNRFFTRDVILNNNRFLSSEFQIYGMKGQRARITNNFIYDEFYTNVPSDDFYTNEDYVFSNNTIVERKQKNQYTDKKHITINANFVHGNQIKTQNNLSLCSPMSGDSIFNAGYVWFRDSHDDRSFSGLTINSYRNYIFIKSDNVVNRKKISFTDMKFTSSTDYYSAFTFKGAEGRTTPMTFDVYFNRCSFTSLNKSVQYPLFSTENVKVTGDKYYFHFVDCEFDLKDNRIANDTTYFELVTYKDCVSPKQLTFNGVEVANSSEGSAVTINTAWGSSQSDDAVPSTKLVKESLDTKANSSALSGYVEKTGLKTVNNQSLLGEGNINISGGSSVDIITAWTSSPSDTDVPSSKLVSNSFYDKTTSDTRYLQTNAIKTVNGNSLIGYGNVTIQGEKGNDGVSPTISVSKTSGAATISITDATHTEQVTVKDGKDGASPIMNISRLSEGEGNGVSISITNTDGSTSTAVLNDGIGEGNPGIADAPANGKQYARKDGAWTQVSAFDDDLKYDTHFSYTRTSSSTSKQYFDFSFTKDSFYKLAAHFSDLSIDYARVRLVNKATPDQGYQEVVGQGGTGDINTSFTASADYDALEVNYQTNVSNVDIKLTASDTLKGTIKRVSIEDVPSDNKIYGVKNGIWVDVSSGVPSLYPQLLTDVEHLKTPGLSIKEPIDLGNFKFKTGKSYRIKVAAKSDSSFITNNITLSYQTGSSDKQEIRIGSMDGIDTIITAEGDWDKLTPYWHNTVDLPVTGNLEIYMVDSPANIITDAISPDIASMKHTISFVDGLLNLEPKFSTPYKYVCMGDSITSNQVSNIGSVVCNYLGCTPVGVLDSNGNPTGNFAVGGATMTNTDEFTYSTQVANNQWTAYNTLTNQVLRLLQWTTPLGQSISWTHQEDKQTYSIPTSVCTGLGNENDIPDIIYIAMGINDDISYIGNSSDIQTQSSIPYSQLATDSEGNENRNTFAKALRWCIETLRCAYPKAHIFVATPLFAGNDTIDRWKKESVIKKRNAILEICAYNSVYCIDSTLKSRYTNQVASIDNRGIHPRGYYKCLIAKFIAKEIYNNYIPQIPDDEIIY